MLIDGDHNYEGGYSDIRNYYPMLAPLELLLLYLEDSVQTNNLPADHPRCVFHATCQQETAGKRS